MQLPPRADCLVSWREDLLKATGTAGNLVADAHLAALAIEHGCAIYSADNDFKRFPGVEHVNPLA